MRQILVVLAVLLCALPADGDHVCHTYSGNNRPTPTLTKNANAVTVTVEIVSGSGEVGEYVLQTTSGEAFADRGAAVDEAGSVTTATSDVRARVRLKVLPDSGTIVKVCVSDANCVCE